MVIHASKQQEKLEKTSSMLKFKNQQYKQTEETQKTQQTNQITSILMFKIKYKEAKTQRFHEIRQNQNCCFDRPDTKPVNIKKTARVSRRNLIKTESGSQVEI